MGNVRLIVVAACAAAVMGVGASAAFAGEITGNGTYKGVPGKSICSSSGQEDRQWYNSDNQVDPKDPEDVVKGDPAHSQSWGQVVKGIATNGGVGAIGGHAGVPGEACNPTKGGGGE